MSKVIGKYTDLDTTSGRIEESFSDWRHKNSSIAPDNVERLYIQNVLNLYKKQNETDTTLQDDFKVFLENIIFLFKNDSNYDRLRSFDFDDKSQVRVIFPLIVSKLHEIVTYYKRQRKSLKNGRTKLFLNGTEGALEIALYNLIHELSQVNPDSANDMSSYNLTALRVEFVQLYDLFDYYNSTEQSYVRNLEILSKNPIFFNVVNYLQTEEANYGISCETNDVLDIENKIDLSQKYTSCFLSFLSGFDVDYENIPYEQSLKKGENFFYWLSGENLFEKSTKQIQKTDLHGFDWKNATSSSSVLSADIIFVDGPEGKKAAWFKNYDKEIVADEMDAKITKECEFRYPFASKGLSGEGFDWTGASIKQTTVDLQLFYGSEFAKRQYAVDTKYWNTSSLSISSANDIRINESTLVAGGAFASDDYEKSDRIELRANMKDDFFDGIYNDDETHLWLYDFRETEIPITPGDNKIYWPLGKYETMDDLFMEYRDGDSVSLSSISIPDQFIGSIAATNFDDADKIYRLKTYCGPDMECAWLKGVPLSAIDPKDGIDCDCEGETTIVPTTRRYRSGAVQGSLYFKANPNEFTSFHVAGLGEGESINLNNIPGLCGYEHDDTCQYKHLVLNDLSNLSKFLNVDMDVNQWKRCNCKMIKHSPFGHRGVVFTDYSKYADFIVLDTSPEPFSFNAWRGSDGLDYTQSKDFAWFRLQTSPDENIGWGRGQWITGDGSEMVLNSRSQYYYYRSSIDRCEGYDAPYGVFKHAFCDCRYEDTDCVDKNCTPVWMRALRDVDGNWVDSGVPTDMLLESNNFYRYEHADVASYSTERLTVSGSYVTSADVFEINSTNRESVSFLENSRSMEGLGFVWRCPIQNLRAYWTETNLDLETTMIQG